MSGSVPTPQPDHQQGLSPFTRSRAPQLPPAEPDPAVQRKRMLIALGVLLAALVAVVVKDWDFWFPPADDTQSAATSRRKPGTAATTIPATPAPARNERSTAKTPETAGNAPFSATAERAALPPLQVEVVAGNRRTQVPARSNAIRLDMNSGTASPAPAETSPAKAEAVVSAADRVQLSPQTQQSVSVSVPPDYPLLARQMKVQGAVILQALISREGSIQELQIVSGPSILAAAAREAVKQWRFKPYYQSGSPVETQARITVNFTISTN